MGNALLILILPAFVAGLVLLRRGLWPARKGTAPHCPKCAYNLTGLTSERCPECGWEVDLGGIVSGTRRRRWGLILVGLIFMLPLPLVGVRVGQKIDWYRLKPVGWLISDLQSSNVAIARRAYRELSNRRQRGSLSDSAASRLAEACLAEQAKPVVGPQLDEMLDLLGELYEADRLSDAQKAQLFEQSMRLELVVRPRVVLGDPVPLEVQKRVHGPRVFWISMKGNREIMVDGRPIGQHMSFSSGSSGLGAGGSSGMSISCGSPGTHKITLSVPVAIYLGSNEAPAEPCYETEVPLEAEFEILETEPDGYIELIRDPDLDQEMQTAITLTSIEPPGKYDARLKLAIQDLPANVAFEVIARVGDREQRMGDVVLARGTRTNYSISLRGDPQDGPFDLILRSNPDVARKSVDVFRIWEGELVFPDVQAADPASNPAP